MSETPGLKSLSELVVLDFTRYLPGGYTTQVLADLGARVIKVEDTGVGDLCRQDYPVRNGVSYYITTLGRNKESLSIYLKNEEAQGYLRQLAKKADVVVESFRPGVTKKLRVDYESLSAENPGLVYCSLTGYGEFDERSTKASHDLNMQAITGYLDVNGLQVTPMPLVDFATHSVAAQAILAALVERFATGKGTYIDISMFDCFIWWNSMIDSRWCFNGGQCEHEDLDFPAVNYNLYETKDGRYLAFGMIERKFWKPFCEAIGAPDLIDAHIHRRWEVPEAFAKVERIVKEKTLDEWLDWLKDKDFCIEPVLNKDEAIARLVANEPNTIRYIDFARAGRVLQTAIPHHIASKPFDFDAITEAPMLGQDSATCLKEAGATDNDIARLAAEGVVCLGNRDPEPDNAPVFPR